MALVPIKTASTTGYCDCVCNCYELASLRDEETGKGYCPRCSKEHLELNRGIGIPKLPIRRDACAEFPQAVRELKMSSNQVNRYSILEFIVVVQFIPKENPHEAIRCGCARLLSLGARSGPVPRQRAGRNHHRDDAQSGRRRAGFHAAQQQVGTGETQRFSRQEKCRACLLRPCVHRWLNERTSGLSG